MTTLEIEIEPARPVAASCSETELSVKLADGRRVGWYPRRLEATPAERAEVELSAFGVHRPRIDKDPSITGMLRGAKAPNATPPGAID